MRFGTIRLRGKGEAEAGKKNKRLQYRGGASWTRKNVDETESARNVLTVLAGPFPGLAS